MNDADKRPFAEQLTALLEIHNRTPSRGVLQLWWNTLQTYPWAAVERAFADYLGNPEAGRYPPTPAAIVGEIQRRDGRPGVEEAWGLVLESFDERATVVLSAEMFAARTAALPAHQAGDPVAARMAFKEAYVRAVDDARRTLRPVEWQLSLGWDPEGREPVVRQAQERGLLTAEQARKLLPDLTPASGPVAAIAGALAGKKPPKSNLLAFPVPEGAPSELARRELKNIAGILESARKREEEAKIERLRARETERAAWKAKQEQALQDLAAYEARRNAAPEPQPATAE